MGRDGIVEFFELFRSIVPKVNIPSSPLRELANGTSNMTGTDDEKGGGIHIRLNVDVHLASAHTRVSRGGINKPIGEQARLTIGHCLHRHINHP